MKKYANPKKGKRRAHGYRLFFLVPALASFMLLDTPRGVAQSESSGSLEETLQSQMTPYLPHLSEEAVGQWTAINLNENSEARLGDMKQFIQRIRNPESCWDAEHHRISKPLVQGVCDGVRDFQTGSRSSAVAQVRNALRRIPNFLTGLRNIEQRIESHLASAASSSNTDSRRSDLEAVSERREREARANSESIARESRAMEREGRRAIRENQRLDRRDRCLARLGLPVPHYRTSMGVNDDIRGLSSALRQVRTEVLQRRLEIIISGETRPNASTSHSYQNVTEPAYLASALARGRMNNNVANEMVYFSQDYLDEYGTKQAKQGREELQALLITLKNFHPVMTPAENQAVRNCMAGRTINTRRMRAQRRQERRQAEEQQLRSIDGYIPDGLEQGSAAE